jgi:hypothetical protein
VDRPCDLFADDRRHPGEMRFNKHGHMTAGDRVTERLSRQHRGNVEVVMLLPFIGSQEQRSTRIG